MAFRCPFRIVRRTFTTSNQQQARSAASRLDHIHKAIPAYHYGPSPWYKQSNFGLYGSTRIQFGNKVSEKNEIKTRRKWRPNIRSKRLWSESLNRFIRVKVHARVLRTIDKVGGLDEYLLGDKAARIKDLGMGGWALRWRIMSTDAVRERFRKQRAEMGLPALEEERIGRHGHVVSGETLKGEIKEYDRELEDEEQRAEREDVEDVQEGDEDENLGPGFMEEEPVQPADERPRVNM
ncbi:39S ribosomal protein L24, mitochondrial [Hypocenomyce scalaris]|nr:39S ribosomal protein L24, mitochondrial [Hypocenomyce scalaris]